ncbi:DUF5989 family protein [Verrucomicrobia bacterium]|nr:DUF5989 family protein [Verrucomicrobiota bacterium]
MKEFKDLKTKSNRGLLSELWRMFMDNKKYWMIPLVLILLLMGLIVILGGSSSAPFIYTLF